VPFYSAIDILAGLVIATVALDLAAIGFAFAGAGAATGSGLALAATEVPIGWVSLGITAAVFLAGLIKDSQEEDPFVTMSKPVAEFLPNFGYDDGTTDNEPSAGINLLQGENVDSKDAATAWDSNVRYDSGTNRLIIGGEDVSEALADLFAEALKNSENNAWLVNLFQFSEYKDEAESIWGGRLTWPVSKEEAQAA
jgi:hypothetical protein